VLFLFVSLVFALPALLETPPPGAIPDYLQQRVMARLEGKLLWLFTASMLVAGYAAIRGMLPGTRLR
jgi:hypothetical protein